MSLTECDGGAVRSDWLTSEGMWMCGCGEGGTEPSFELAMEALATHHSSPTLADLVLAVEPMVTWRPTRGWPSYLCPVLGHVWVPWTSSMTFRYEHARCTRCGDLSVSQP